jgi:hypothetical protein
MSEAGAREHASARSADPVLEGVGLLRSFGPIEVLSDPMTPVDVLYSPTMVATAIDITALGLEEGIPVRGDYILKASLITKDNAKDFYFKDSPF